MTLSNLKPVIEQDDEVTPKITNPRQYRAIQALLVKPCTCFELQKIAGARNAPELIRKLRHNGWLIPCQLLDITDRDGKKTKPGRYHLEPDQIPIARQVVSKWEKSHETAREA